MTNEKKTEQPKVGLENLDDDLLAAIVEREMQEHSELRDNSAGDIAFQELTRRSGHLQ